MNPNPMKGEERKPKNDWVVENGSVRRKNKFPQLQGMEES